MPTAHRPPKRLSGPIRHINLDDYKRRKAEAGGQNPASPVQPPVAPPATSN